MPIADSRSDASAAQLERIRQRPSSISRRIALPTGGQPGTKTPRSLCGRVQFPMNSVPSGTDSCPVPIATVTLGESVDYPPYEATRAFYKKHGFAVYQRNQTDNPNCPEELKLKKVIT